MLCILVLVILLQLVLFIQSPSSDIWSKAMKYMQEGKMKYPKDMNYFIFDESNYTALEINGTEMNDLFLSQQELYKDFGIPNYITIPGKCQDLFEISFIYFWIILGKNVIYNFRKQPQSLNFSRNNYGNIFQKIFYKKM